MQSLSSVLGNVVRHRKEFIQIDDAALYKRCRVQLHAKGIVVRDELEGAAIKTKKQQICRAGQFLVAEIDAKLGGYGIVPEELEGAIVSSHYFLFDVETSKLDRAFLGYFIRTPYFHDQVGARGSTNYAAIRPAHVLGYQIPLPPLAEQRRIVAKIEALAAKIEEARGLRCQGATEVDALASAFVNGIVESYRRTASTVGLGEIGEIKSGVTLGRELRGEVVHLPYLRVANVQDGHLDLGVVKSVAVRVDETEKWKLHAGDILLTEGGDWDKLGRGTVWNDEIPDCIHQNHIFRIRVNVAYYDPRYIVALTSSPYGRTYFAEASKQTTNLASINQRQLRDFPVFRIPIDEQQSLLDELEALRIKADHLKALQAQTAAELDALLPSILDKAFKGEL